MAQAGEQPGRQPFNQLFLSATTIPATTATATGGQLIVGIKVRWASITFGDLLWASKYSAHPLVGIIWWGIFGFKVWSQSFGGQRLVIYFEQGRDVPCCEEVTRTNLARGHQLFLASMVGIIGGHKTSSYLFNTQLLLYWSTAHPVRVCNHWYNSNSWWATIMGNVGWVAFVWRIVDVSILSSAFVFFLTFQSKQSIWFYRCFCELHR